MMDGTAPDERRRRSSELELHDSQGEEEDCSLGEHAPEVSTRLEGEEDELDATTIRTDQHFLPESPRKRGLTRAVSWLVPRPCLGGSAVERKRWHWKVAIGLALCVGYAGYYVCRSNLSVASPPLLHDLDISKATLGVVLTAGTAAYACGKFVSGPVIDVLGGRKVFLLAMLISVLLTIAFTFGSEVWYFTLIVIGNRFVQAAGWPAAVKLASNWYHSKEAGKAMGFISLSFLFGDAIARFYLAGVLEVTEDSWKAVFWVSAATLGAIGVMCVFVLKGSPADVGLPPEEDDSTEEPEQGSVRIVGEVTQLPTSLKERLLPLFKTPRFWLLCLMSFGLTMIRSTFTDWGNVYLTDQTHASSSEAALGSIMFPLSGGFSCLLMGWLNDRVPRQKRGIMLLAFLVPLVVTLGGYAMISSHSLPLALVFVTIAGFTLTGPYTLPAGAFSLSVGGPLCATVSSFVDTAGYGGGLLSGYLVGLIADNFGWSTVWGLLAIVALVASLFSVGFAFFDFRHSTRDHTAIVEDPISSAAVAGFELQETSPFDTDERMSDEEGQE